MTIEEINLIPTHHLKFDDIKGLSVDELIFLRIEALDKLTSLEVVIINIKRKGGEWHTQATIRAHLKRIIGTLNGIIASRNRARDKIKTEQKEKLRNAHIKIVSLEKEIRNLNKNSLTQYFSNNRG